MSDERWRRIISIIEKITERVVRLEEKFDEHDKLLLGQQELILSMLRTIHTMTVKIEIPSCDMFYTTNRNAPEEVKRLSRR